MKFNKTVAGVIVFVLVLLAAGYSAKSSAEENGARISLGHSFVNSHLKTGEIGYEHNDWEVNATLMEEGDTANGYQDQLEIFSVSYLTKPQWSYKGVDAYFRLGVSYNSGSAIVGRRNFRLGIGADFHNVWRIEYSHHSSSGIEPVNSGIDYITLTYKTPTLF